MSDPLTVTKEVFMQHVHMLQQNDVEKKEAAEARKEILSSAKTANIDTKQLQTVVKLLERRDDDLAEEEFILDAYKGFAGIK